MGNYTGTVERVEILRLHTDSSGFVWYGDDDQLGVNSYLEAGDFIQGDVVGCDLDHVRCIRLLGTQANAPLVVALHQRRAADPGLAKRQRIQLGSPAVVSSSAMRDSPEHVLQHLWQPTYSSVLSGLWHDMANEDFCTYAMLTEMQNQGVHPDDDVLPEVVRRIAAYHPAWPALSFVHGLHLTAACRLLMEVVDPRWYRHPFRPHRPTRLYAHLGLTPQNMAAYLGRAHPDRNYYRAGLAVSCWHCAGANDGFLWKSFAACDDRVKGLLRTTQRFVNFVQAVWLYAVSPPHPEVTFNPHLFFKDGRDAEAFAAHRAALKPV